MYCFRLVKGLVGGVCDDGVLLSVSGGRIVV